MGSSVDLFSGFTDERRLLVETGTWLGDGIAKGLEAGFAKVISCDVNPEFVVAASARFSGEPVEIMALPSVDALTSIVADLDEPAVFFLDAHGMPPDAIATRFSESTLLDGTNLNDNLTCPLLGEIRAVLGGSSLEHVILVDDRQNFGTWQFHYLTEHDVRELVNRLRPEEYQFGTYQNVLTIVPKGVQMPAESVWKLTFRRLRRILRHTDPS